jgi:nicotinamidase/pyrazinamidase
MAFLDDLFRGNDALLVVDVQNDFCPGGKLAIADGDKVVPVLNQLIEKALEKKIPVFLSRDWHPLGHPSFKNGDGEWPVHCVQDTEGARFHPDLKIPENAPIITKGVRFDMDQNSIFEHTGLAYKLRNDGIKRLVMGGLAQDVCVLESARQALSEGFEVVVPLSATRPVTPDGGKQAVLQLKTQGAKIIDESDYK